MISLARIGQHGDHMNKEHQAYLKWGFIFFPFYMLPFVALFILFGPKKIEKKVPISIKEAQALELAEKEFVSKFGNEVLKQKPFITQRTDDTWIVEGTFHCPEKESCKGGIARIEMLAKDGSVLEVTRGK